MKCPTYESDLHGGLNAAVAAGSTLVVVTMRHSTRLRRTVVTRQNHKFGGWGFERKAETLGVFCR